MRYSVRSAPWMNLKVMQGLCGVGLGAFACGSPPQKELPLPYEYPRCEIVKDDGAYELGIPASVALAEGPAGVVLIAWGEHGLQWYPVTPTGALGPRAGRIQKELGYLGGIRIASEATLQGFRIWTLYGVTDIATNTMQAERREYDFSALGSLRPRILTSRARVQGRSYVTWAGMEANAGGALGVAGLGIIDDDSLVITPIGTPYFRSGDFIGNIELNFTAGWDEKAGISWVDMPGSKEVLKLATDGTILGRFAIQGDGVNPYIVNKLLLGSGRWSGGHMWRWFTFDMTERYWHQPPPSFPWTGMFWGTFSGGGATQFLDSRGRVWIAESNHGSVYIRHFDESLNTVSDPVETALWEQVCPPRQ